MVKKDVQQDRRQRSLLHFFEPTAGAPASDAAQAGPLAATSDLIVNCIDTSGACDGETQDVAGVEAPAVTPSVSLPSDRPAAPQFVGEVIEADKPPQCTTQIRAGSSDECARSDRSDVSDEDSSEEEGRAALAAASIAPAALRARGGLTAYELERLERIRCNEEKMRSLGLVAGCFAGLLGNGSLPKTRRQVQGPRAKRPPPAPAGPPRRSSRHKPDGAVASRDPSLTQRQREAVDEQAEPPVEYNDSSVRRYVCGTLADGPGRAARRGRPSAGADISGFAQIPGMLRDAALSRAYSVDWQLGLVVAGGKDGQVSLWGSACLEAGQLPAAAGSRTGDRDRADGSGDAAAHGEDGSLEVAPLLSHRLHRGWVSDVQFCTASTPGGGAAVPGGDALLLLTAGNDGTVSLWDVGREAVQGRHRLPRRLAEADDVHCGGIFSMHEAGGGRVLTASKDCSVAVSAVAEGGTLRPLHRYTDAHEGVVKCARWCPGGGGAPREGGAAVVFASCGNDRAIRVVDTRLAAAGGGLELRGGHSTPVNCLRWSPGSEHVLLSASHDPHILMHDLRAPGQALHSLAGHAAGRRIDGIYQPAFVAGGRGVAAGGDASGTLSLYCAATGAAISRGEVGFSIGATFCGSGDDDLLICTASRGVALFAPSWQLGPATEGDECKQE